MNYNREGFVKKTLVFPGSSCSFFGSHTMRMPGRNIFGITAWGTYPVGMGS
ncbi:Hypothetical protein ACI5QL_02820 [Bacillus velezensis]